MITRTTAQHGQMLVLFALLLTGLLGAAGLVLDLGYNYAQRRLLQNDVDAAVTVGLNDLVDAPSATNADVSAALTANHFPQAIATTSSWSCVFLDNSDASLGDCATSPVPSSTSGVRVNVSETRSTFFLGVLGIGSTSVGAVAAGHIRVASGYPAGDSPFLVCGHLTVLDSNNGKFGSGTQSIYQEITTPGLNGDLPYESWPPTINANVIAASQAGSPFNFLIFDSNQGNSGKGINDCGLGSNFKGALAENSGILSIPTWVHGQKGMKTGPVRTRVANGCNTAAPFSGCILVIPIAEEVLAYPNPAGVLGGNQPQCTGSGVGELCIDMWVAMKVYNVAPNRYAGQVVSPQPTIQADGVADWTVGSQNNLGSVLISLQLTQ